MSYLVDTNVLSELVRNQPAEAVARWFEAIPPQEIYVSVITLGELRRGVERLAESPKRTRLRRWLEHELLAGMQDRVLPVDQAVAERWGRLMAESERTLPAFDSLLAATALHHHLDMVTRNKKDFQHAGLHCIDPWQEGK